MEENASTSSPTRNERTDRYAGTAHLSEREYHRLLSAGRRETTLDVLVKSTAPLELDDLAAAVAARENGGGGEEHVERVAVTLHHVHLPKMADLGVVDYDPDTARVGPYP